MIIWNRVEIKIGTFFFFDIDDRLKGKFNSINPNQVYNFPDLEGLESFVRTEDLNELERTWPTKRKEIGEVCNFSVH